MCVSPSVWQLCCCLLNPGRVNWPTNLSCTFTYCLTPSHWPRVCQPWLSLLTLSLIRIGWTSYVVQAPGLEFELLCCAHLGRRSGNIGQVKKAKNKFLLKLGLKERKWSRITTRMLRHTICLFTYTTIISAWALTVQGPYCIWSNYCSASSYKCMSFWGTQHTEKLPIFCRGIRSGGNIHVFFVLGNMRPNFDDSPETKKCLSMSGWAMKR